MVTLLFGLGISSPPIHTARVALGLQGCVKGSYTHSPGTNKDVSLVASQMGGIVPSIHDAKENSWSQCPPLGHLGSEPSP